MIYSRLHGFGYLLSRWLESSDGYEYAYAAFYFGGGRHRIKKSELVHFEPVDIFSSN
ncbi:MAG: hypothetical protein AAFZ15_32410 [Bacteroidota bacterium]